MQILFSEMSINYILRDVRVKYLPTGAGLQVIRTIIEDPKRHEIIDVTVLADVLKFYVEGFSEVVFQLLLDEIPFDDLNLDCDGEMGLLHYMIKLIPTVLPVIAKERFFQKFIDTGTDVNVLDAEGRSPLWFILALWPRKIVSLKMLKMLLHAGAKVTGNVINIMTCMRREGNYTFPEVVIKLLQESMDKDVGDLFSIFADVNVNTGVEDDGDYDEESYDDDGDDDESYDDEDCDLSNEDDD